jgi:hypothetical protein
MCEPTISEPLVYRVCVQSAITFTIFSLYPSSYFSSNGPVVVRLLPVQYTPCQKLNYWFTVIKWLYTIAFQLIMNTLLQFINHHFAPFRCPNAVTVRPRTYIIYTPSLYTVGSQLPNIQIKCLFCPAHVLYILQDPCESPALHYATLVCSGLMRRVQRVDYGCWRTKRAHVYGCYHQHVFYTCGVRYFFLKAILFWYLHHLTSFRYDLHTLYEISMFSCYYPHLYQCYRCVESICT